LTNLSRKISALEKNVVSDNPDPQETYIYTTNEGEQELFKVARKIMEKQTQQLTALEDLQELNPNVDYTAEMDAILELNDEAEAIVSQAERIIIRRGMYIFDRVIACRYHLNDPQNRFIFYLRFSWFLSEMQDMLHHSSMENKIMDESGFFDLCRGEQDNKLQVCYDSWREWFSQESFDQWFKAYPITSPNIKSNEEAAKAEEEYAALTETEQKAKEKNAKYLKEKCPTCSNKCSWYNEQNQV
jgi:hypothetical protein